MDLFTVNARLSRLLGGVLCILALTLIIRATAQQGTPSYHVIRTTTLGGTGSWDYLSFDTSARLLYISHDKQVLVFDPEKNKVVGYISGLDGTHGIALAKEFGKGFISSGADDTIVVFDLASRKVLSRIRSTGRNPDCIIFDPFTKRIFTFNGLSGTATAIQVSTGTIAGTVELGGSKPEFAVTDSAGHLWVNLEDKDETIELDPAALRVTARFALGPCHQPASLALDSQHRRLFVGCRNQTFAALNADSGQVISTIPIGAGVDANIFNRKDGLIFTANRDGTISVISEISPDSFALAQTVKTEPAAGSLAFDGNTGKLYTVTADLGPMPPPTKEHPRPRAPVVPGTFRVLTISK